METENNKINQCLLTNEKPIKAKDARNNLLEKINNSKKEPDFLPSQKYKIFLQIIYKIENGWIRKGYKNNFSEPYFYFEEDFNYENKKKYFNFKNFKKILKIDLKLLGENFLSGTIIQKINNGHHEYFYFITDEQFNQLLKKRKSERDWHHCCCFWNCY